ncbi:MAG: Ldh family oxidoreductase [Desulfopila sp.]|jgi:(2R)-3-sulfolactate dehydrogenase (NADP+)|nr:Ldh family oxidoreductase [Desulfopila sp.]
MASIHLAPEKLIELVRDILIAHNTSPDNAHEVALALVAAETDGQKGHGLARVAAYAAQAGSGKVLGKAKPSIRKALPSLLCVDAHSGFAYPALSLAVEELARLTAATGIAAAAVTNSHHCGAAGYHAEKLAEKGFVALVFSNTPKAIAPWGGKEALFGTNPIAFAAPRKQGPPLVIDLSLSRVARGKIKMAAQEGRTIPEGWALDNQGRNTTSAAEAMQGTMLPMGEAKGAALVLMVEILSAALTSSHFGFEASSFFEAEGPSPGIGQLLIALSPAPLSSDTFLTRIEVLFEAILAQEGTRLPGANKTDMRNAARTQGLEIDKDVYDALKALLGD